MYADDQIILAASDEAILQRGLLELYKIISDFSMEISEEKIKTMAFRRLQSYIRKYKYQRSLSGCHTYLIYTKWMSIIKLKVNYVCRTITRIKKNQ